MDLEVQHVEIHVSSIEAARMFYVGMLGLELLDDLPRLDMFAVRAGAVRLSIFGGYHRVPGADRACGTHLIFRVPGLTAAMSELADRGVIFTGDIVEADGFMRDIAMQDPDGNVIELAEYQREPLLSGPTTTSQPDASEVVKDP